MFYVCSWYVSNRKPVYEADSVGLQAGVWRALRRFECKELTNEQVAEAGVNGVLENVEHDCVYSRVFEAKLPIHFHDVPIA